MIAPGAIRTALSGLVLWLGFFAGWTLGSVPLTLTCAPFGALWIAGALGGAGAVLARLLLYPLLVPVLLTPGAMRPAPDLPQGRQCLLWAGGGLTLGLAGLFFLAMANALPLWIVLVALGLTALVLPGNTPARQQKPEVAAPMAAWAALCLIVLVTIGLHIVLLRPDADDAFYLNLPIGLIAQQTCMMATDTMYGAESWPFLGSNYRVESLPTLTAALSWATGLPVITVAHLVLPVIWCVLWAATLAVIGHGLFGARWWIFATLALLGSMALAGTLQSWGVHGITRLFHGKGPLIVIVFPLVGFVAARAAASQLGFRPSLAALAGLTLAALGLTANAIYLAPLVLLFSLLAAQIVWPHAGWTRAGLIVAAIPPVAAGLWLLLFDKPPSAGEDTSALFSTDLSLWNMAADKLTLAPLLATLAAAAVAARMGPAGRWITAYLVAFLILTLNPVLWPFYDRFVTGGLNFRLWWALPLPLFLAIAVTWAIIRTGWVRLGTLGAGAGFALLAMLPSGLIGMNGTLLQPSWHKIPPAVAPAVQDILAAPAPDGTVLAPEEIATWLPTRAGHPGLVYSRRLYLVHSAPAVASNPELARREGIPRQMLADWINGSSQPSAAELRSALAALEVSSIALPSDTSPAGAEATLRAALAPQAPQQQAIRGGYVLFRLPMLKAP